MLAVLVNSIVRGLVSYGMSTGCISGQLPYGASWDEIADSYTVVIGPVPRLAGYGMAWNQDADSYTTITG